jgi:hypothetical protein
MEDSQMDGMITGRTILESFSKSEVACIMAELGDETFQALLDTPVMAAGPDFEFPNHCLSQESAIAMSVALLSAHVGGLTPESQSCLQGFYAEYGIEPAVEDPAAAIEYGLRFSLCLTDEEAEALADPSDPTAGLPKPSELRCISEHTDIGNLALVVEAFLLSFGGDPGSGQPSQEMMEAMTGMMTAAAACGLDITSFGTPG